MIARLSGNVIKVSEHAAVIDVGGVGYKIFATGQTLAYLQEGGAASLWTHLAVRENAQDLYGFLSDEELKFFELLIGVSGIGPKTALNIMNVAHLNTLKQAVHSGNSGHLTKVSGIGKKNAEKIVLELSGKLGRDEGQSAYFQEEADAIEALSSLGYSQKEARDALKGVPAELGSTSERVKYALKQLAKQ